MAKRYSLSLNFFILIFSASVLRIILSQFGTLQLDFNTFFSWSHSLEKDGFSNFYNSWSDYLPGYLYILWLLGKVSVIFPEFPQLLLYKLPAILADLATGILIFKIVSSLKNEKLALISSALYLFNPAILFNSTLWGQVDSITAFFVLLTLFFSGSKSTLSAIFLALGALVKPQAGFIAPIIGLLWFKKYGFKKTGLNSLLSFSIFVLGFLPFVNENNIFSFVSERLGITANQYPHTSVNAFNFWALGGLWQKDDTAKFLGIIIITFITIILIKYFVENFKNSNRYLLVSCLLLISFLFLTRMHERHLLPVLAPLVIAAVEFPLLLIPYVILSFTYILNLHYSFVWITNNYQEIFGPSVVAAISLVNLFCGALIIFVFLRAKDFQYKNFQFSIFNFQSIRNFANKKNKEISYKELIPDKLVHPLLMGILIFALTSRIIFLNFPTTFYFDEVYHAWTAREMLQGNAAAWEWWNTPPEGFAYEWSHPPTAKLFMWSSMFLMGETSFAWRLPGALLGAAMVYLVYLLGVQLFKNKTIGIFSAAIFTLEGLPLVMSRIGMNDTYFLFFSLIAVLLFLKDKYLFSSIFLGLAAASKWTTFWVFVLLFLAMVMFRKKPRFSIFWFFIIPPLVYLASYIPFFLTGHSFGKFIELQQQMWWYHTGLSATHAYSSSAWSWSLDLRPVWLFVDGSKDASGLVSNIYAFGNPLVIWLGLAAVVISGIIGLVKRQKVLIFISVGWGLMFLPWVFSPRIMFFYHYLPAIPFLSLALGWFLSQQRKGMIIAVYILLATSYLFFFPHWTGIFVPKWLDQIYYIIPSWK